MTHSRSLLCLSLAFSLFAGSASAAIKTKAVTYKAGTTQLAGFFAWDDAVKEKRPGVLVVHEWWGHNQHARDQAIRLAKAGYVGFALDMYGKGKVATHPKDAVAFMQEATKDPAQIQARFNAGLEQLKKSPHVNPEKIAVIGYCFGGGVALTEAEAGLDVKGVATFHGALPETNKAEKGAVKARLLVMTGADDPMVPPEKVEAFKKAMTEAGAKVEVISYPGAKHAFTNPAADKAGVPALAYNAEADKLSWEQLEKFLKEIFAA